MEPSTRPYFRHCVVVFNPGSTRAGDGAAHVKELQAYFVPEHLTIITTKADDPMAEQRQLAERVDLLGPRTLLAVIAGDGTVNGVVDFLARGPGLSSAARRTVILPLWGGNANDLAHMLNGAPYTDGLERFLGRGHIARIYPLACSLTYPDGRTETRIAACYISFGATAQAARRLNEPAHRNHAWRRQPIGRMLKDFTAVVMAISNSPSFAIEQDGKERKMLDYMYLNGSRMAKMGVAPAKLHREEYYPLTLEPLRPHTFLSGLWGMIIRRPGRVAAEHFTVRQRVWMQFDGETLEVPPDTRITVGPADHPVFVFSSRLPELSRRQKRKAQ